MGRTIAFHFFHTNKTDTKKSKNNLLFYFDKIPIKVDKIYRSINIELEHECKSINTSQPQRLPQIIVLDKFLEELKNYIQNSQRYVSAKYDINYKDYPILLTLVRSHKNFMHYIHIPKKKDGRWFCEGRFFTFDELYAKDRKTQKEISDIIKKNNIDDYDEFFEEWVGLIFHLAAEYLLFKKRLKVIFFSCDKCHRPGVFIKGKLENDDDPDKIFGTINVVDTIIYNCINILNLKTPEKERSKNNIILYDESYNNQDQNISEEYESFKDETDGAFILVTNEIDLVYLIEEIKFNDNKFKFDLIIKGTTPEIIKKQENLDNYFDRVYEYKLSNQPDEIKRFIHFKKQNSELYPTFKLITSKEYNNKYMALHRLISSHYGQNEENYFKIELSYLKDFLLWNPELKIKNNQNEFKIESLLETLENFEKIEGNEENIIRLYTMEDGSYYKDFNNWLNNVDPLAIQKTSWFIAAVIYCLNSYSEKKNKGVKEKSLKLYRGTKINFSDLLSYKKLKGELICYSSFTSTTRLLSKAYKFSSEGENNGKYETIITINYSYKDGFIPTAVDVSEISDFKEEKECLFFPYSFFKVKNIKINHNKKRAEIELDAIGKKEIIETQLRDGYKLEYNAQEDLMEVVAEKQS